MSTHARVLLHHGDITRLPADAVVNAANATLLGGGGVDGAIHRSGGPEVLRECRELRAARFPDGLPTGQAVATGAGELPARWVIHTVGPVHGRTRDGAQRLADCYRNSLAVADELGALTVAFPLISAGAYGWPRDEAVRTALDSIATTPTTVEAATLVLFDAATLRLAESLVG
ncbi:O-acetyl-ADP-ribose deacetylase [Dietzia sp. SLG310A2-38A2]|uniref:O-acetyl-ADP-ribose deacetylase n=1 Tax=Dietzia sp. SLG310A2-38A2 TaxID=1630643 RepID=UPI0015F91B64|nr:O-acetyl-ADP-ribose deacetylase [Dietzia sp. SLG310A2-38A2]MBB1031320.1 O-acetyl-ADP-ribose deacetylase [Dietzia sp. SLG310A2-38A2]